MKIYEFGLQHIAVKWGLWEKLERYKSKLIKLSRIYMGMKL
jgi:hypothetical protein